MSVRFRLMPQLLCCTAVRQHTTLFADLQVGICGRLAIAANDRKVRIADVAFLMMDVPRWHCPNWCRIFADFIQFLAVVLNIDFGIQIRFKAHRFARIFNKALTIVSECLGGQKIAVKGDHIGFHL